MKLKGRKIIIFTVIICVITGCSALKPDEIIDPLSPSSPVAADCPETSQREKFAWTAGSITAVVLVIIICGYGVYKFCNRTKERTWCVRIKPDETSAQELVNAVKSKDGVMHRVFRSEGLSYMATEFVLQEKREDKGEPIFRKEFNLYIVKALCDCGAPPHISFTIDGVLYAVLKVTLDSSPPYFIKKEVLDLCEIKGINPLSIDDLEVELTKSDDDFPITKLITIIEVKEKK